MWTLHWFEQTIETGGPVTPPESTTPGTYRAYRYLGVPTFLTMPVVDGIRYFLFIAPQQVIELPPSWPWTIRALENNILEAI